MLHYFFGGLALLTIIGCGYFVFTRISSDEEPLSVAAVLCHSKSAQSRMASTTTMMATTITSTTTSPAMSTTAVWMPLPSWGRRR